MTKQWPLRPTHFVAREQELRSFKTTLRAVKSGRRPHCILVHGDGGMGKSTLLAEYFRISSKSKSASVVYIDCADLAGGATGSQTIALMSFMASRFESEGFSFKLLRDTQKARADLQTRLELERRRFTGDFAAFEDHVRSTFTAEAVELFDKRSCQLLHSRAFAADLRNALGQRPIILLLDTYESIAAFADEWIRGCLYHYCAGNREVAGPLLVVTAGRITKLQEAAHRDDCRGYLGEDAFTYQSLTTFTVDDIESLAKASRRGGVSKGFAQRIWQISHGFPLAVAELLASCPSNLELEDRFADLKPNMSTREMLSVLTRRLFKYVFDPLERHAIYALAMLRGGYPESTGPSEHLSFELVAVKSGLVATPQDCRDIVERLTEKHSFLFPGGRLQADVREILRDGLANQALDGSQLRDFNERAAEISHQNAVSRLTELETELGHQLARRRKYRDLIWKEFYFSWLNHQLWLGQAELVLSECVSESVMALLHGGASFASQVHRFLSADLAFLAMFSEKQHEIVEKLGNLKEWLNTTEITSKGGELLSLLKSDAAAGGVLLKVQMALDANDVVRARTLLNEADLTLAATGPALLCRDLGEAYHNLGRHIASGNAGKDVLEGALSLLRRALELCPEHFVHCGIADVHIRLSQFKDARASFESALRLRPGSAEAANGLRRLSDLQLNGKWSRRRRAAELTAMAAVDSSQGDYVAAKSKLKEACDAYPKYLPAAIRWAHILRQQGDAAAAIRRLQGIEKTQQIKAQDRARLYDAFGACFFVLERFEQAAEAYERAVVAANGYMNALHGLGRSLLRLNQPKEAHRKFEDVLTLRANAPLETRASLAWVHVSLALAYLELGHRKLALEHFESAEIRSVRWHASSSRRHVTLACLGLSRLGQGGPKQQEGLSALSELVRVLVAPGFFKETLLDVQFLRRHDSADLCRTAELILARAT